ncbi:MAG: apolipoprotein N-acyltransferase [Elusimicrobia bacterium]|nr:apolipoprotein N-acyltransferase [Elusimicrobiota bacterium]
MAVQNEKPLISFLYGILTGLMTYLGILYWLVPTFSAAGEPKIIGITVLLLFSLYLALYYGIFCFFSSLTTYHLPLTAFFWVSLEFIRTHLFTGFPWALLGYSQWNNLPIIQISEFTGIYGISFLIVLINLTIVKIIKERTLKCAATSFLLISTCLIFGFYKLHEPRTTNYELRTISILQGNIDQYKKWNEKYEQEIIDTYTLLTTCHLPLTTDLIVWPESSIPGFLKNDKKLYAWISDIAKKTKTQHLVASNDYKQVCYQRSLGNSNKFDFTRSLDYKNGKFYNSAFLVSADGKITGEYSKSHLVPFGEYMPLRNFLSKFIKVVNEIGEFSSGEKYNIINSTAGKLGVNICFEAIFPNEVRKSAKNGAEIIVNLTNDAWYLKTSAPYQHFSMNVFRAVENRRFVVRAANTGVSGFIDPTGRVKSETKIFETAILSDKIFALNHITFYTKFGDIFSYLCIIISIILLTFRKKFDKL